MMKKQKAPYEKPQRLNNYGTGAWLKAAEGYYFTVEDLGDNGDGTSSWLYKVRKSQ